MDYLTGEEILSFNQIIIIKQAKFTYSLLRKAFKKQAKAIKGQGKKQVDTFKALKTKKLEAI